MCKARHSVWNARTDLGYIWTRRRDGHPAYIATTHHPRWLTERMPVPEPLGFLFTFPTWKRPTQIKGWPDCSKRERTTWECWWAWKSWLLTWAWVSGQSTDAESGQASRGATFMGSATKTARSGLASRSGSGKPRSPLRPCLRWSDGTTPAACRT